MITLAHKTFGGKKMKKMYENPKMDVAILKNSDIIICSGNDTPIYEDPDD